MNDGGEKIAICIVMFYWIAMMMDALGRL